MTLSLLQEPVLSFEDDNGRPLSGGQLFTYAAGTLTPKATFQDQAGTIPNTNPITLNARGEATVYGSGNYRFILKDRKGVTIWDRDNIASPDSIAGDVLSDLSDTEDTTKGDALVGVLQPFPGAIATTQHVKNAENVSIQDFGATPSSDDVEGSVVAAASSGAGCIRVPTGTFKATLKSQASIAAVWPKLGSFQLDGSFTLNIAAGVYDCPSTAVVSGRALSNLSILGADPIPVSILNVTSVVEKTFNVLHWDNVTRSLKYSEVTYRLNSTGGISVGQYLQVGVATGHADAALHLGGWEIVGVDAGANTVTVLHTGNMTPPSGSITGSANVIATVIRFLNSYPKGLTALLFEDGAVLGNIDRVALVGTGRPVVDGQRGPSGYDCPGGNGGVEGVIARDSATINIGPNFVCSGFSGTNVTSNRAGSIVAAAGAASCNAARNGWSAAFSSATQASGVIAAGNLIDNFIAQDASFGFYPNTVSTGSHRHGYIVSGGATINASGASQKGGLGNGVDLINSSALVSGGRFDNNVGCAINASASFVRGPSSGGTGNGLGGVNALNGAVVNVSSGNFAGNTTFDYQAVNAYIDATGASGTPVLIPTANHLSATGGYIRSGTPSFLGFTTTLTNSAMRISDTNHIWIGTATDLAGQSGARLHCNGSAVFGGSILPSSDNTYNLGSGSLRMGTIFAGTGAINTSDERQKQQIEAIPEAALRAWGKVNFVQFKFKDAVAEKGPAARLHFGVIAQRVKEAFESEGLDPFAYGVLCLEQWPDIYEDIMEATMVLDDVSGSLYPIEIPSGERRLVIPAGEMLMIRYEEALALECAYLRWRLEQPQGSGEATA